MFHKPMNTPLRPVLFLDRDGTLTVSPDLTWQESQLAIAEGIAEEIAACNAAKIPVIVITNQPVVARGWVTEDGVRALHATINERLKAFGAYIDAFYFCPHHPESTLPEYRMRCDCRKPATGLFEKAAADFPIDFAKSFMVGDMTQDILAGKNAGCRTILVMAGHGGNDGKYEVTPDYAAQTAAEAVRMAREAILHG
jgi:mannose-1-phosphate guanylyltransferase / phosphomannomutase